MSFSGETKEKVAAVLFLLMCLAGGIALSGKTIKNSIRALKTQNEVDALALRARPLLKYSERGYILGYQDWEAYSTKEYGMLHYALAPSLMLRADIGQYPLTVVSCPPERAKCSIPDPRYQVVEDFGEGLFIVKVKK